MKICTENSLLTSGFGGTMPSSVIGRLTGTVVRLTTGIFSRQLEPRRYLPSQPEPLHLIDGARNGRLAELPASAWFREPETTRNRLLGIKPARGRGERPLCPR